VGDVWGKGCRRSQQGEGMPPWGGANQGLMKRKRNGLV
jgi:hypothetical protein